MTTVMKVHPALTRKVFEMAKDLIAKAADPTPETPLSLLQLVEAGDADFWIAGEEGGGVLGVGFTQILKRPKDTVFNVLAVAGVRGWRWMHAMRNAMREDAKARGADKAILIRVAGHKSYFGAKPAGYYYEDMLDAR